MQAAARGLTFRVQFHDKDGHKEGQATFGDLVESEVVGVQSVDMMEAVREGGRWIDGSEWLLGLEREMGWLGVSAE